MTTHKVTFRGGRRFEHLPRAALDIVTPLSTAANYHDILYININYCLSVSLSVSRCYGSNGTLVWNVKLGVVPETWFQQFYWGNRVN